MTTTTFSTASANIVAKWVKNPNNGEWRVKAIGAKEGDTVIVRSNAGKETKVRLGQEWNGSFAVGILIPEVITMPQHDKGLEFFTIDGKKYYQQGCQSDHAEVPTKSGEYYVSFGPSVMHDVFYVCLKKNDGTFTKHPHYCGFKGFSVAVAEVIRLWETM